MKLFISKELRRKIKLEKIQKENELKDSFSSKKPMFYPDFRSYLGR